MVAWLFFDLGWTLIDETAAHRQRWEIVSHCLSEWHIARSVEDLELLAVREATAFASSPFRSVLDRLDLTDQQREVLIRATPYPKERERLYPTTLAVLERLHPDYHLGVVANQSPGTESRLRSWGILDQFSVVASSAELGLSKPNARIFRHAMQEANCTPKQAAFIGDRLDNDIGPAKRLGCWTIRILQGMHRLQTARTPEERADLTLRTLDQLPEALKDRGFGLG